MCCKPMANFSDLIHFLFWKLQLSISVGNEHTREYSVVLSI